MAKDYLGGVSYKSKKKSNILWWAALWSIVLVGCMVAGFHYGGIELLKLQADERAVASLELPVPQAEQPKVTTWKVKAGGQTLTYRFMVFPNGLECLTAGARAPDCNWAKYNAEQAQGDGS